MKKLRYNAPTQIKSGELPLGNGLFSMHFLNAIELNSTKPNGKIQPTSMLSGKPLGGEPMGFNDGGAPEPKFESGQLQPSGDVTGEAKIQDIRATNVTKE